VLVTVIEFVPTVPVAAASVTERHAADGEAYRQAIRAAPRDRFEPTTDVPVTGNRAEVRRRAWCPSTPTPVESVNVVAVGMAAMVVPERDAGIAEDRPAHDQAGLLFTAVTPVLARRRGTLRIDRISASACWCRT